MPEPSSSVQSQTNKLIADLWKRNEPIILERLALLDASAASAMAGPLTEPQRAEAESVAHKLSGSLGMFGYHEGTKLARAMEQQLQTNSPDGGLLTELSASLRLSLFPETESDHDQP